MLGEYLGFVWDVLARKPFACSLAPTNFCNLRCGYCYSPKSLRKELTLREFAALCDRLVEEGVKLAVLTDGEPLLNGDSRGKCEAAVERFRWVWVVTNGTFKLPDWRCTFIVSLDGGEEVHDFIRGGGVFRRVKENVAGCSGVYAHLVVSRWNWMRLAECVRSVERVAEEGVFVSFETPWFLPYESRVKCVETLLELKREGANICNTEFELKTLLTDWWVKCPKWFVKCFDAYGVEKKCVFGDRCYPLCGCLPYVSVYSMLRFRGSCFFRRRLFR